jgi:hypothetical protein
VTVVDQLSMPAAAIYGGLRIDDSSPDDADCTSGFSVRHVSQAVGISLAGHCANTGMNYGGTTLPYHSGVYSGSHDEQWHTTPGFTPTNRIRYHEDGNTRPITSRRIRSTQSIGDPVCKFGVTTGYDCGNIINRSFAPSWVPNALPTFIVAEHVGVDMSSPEDSGRLRAVLGRSSAHRLRRPSPTGHPRYPQRLRRDHPQRRSLDGASVASRVGRWTRTDEVSSTRQATSRLRTEPSSRWAGHGSRARVALRWS